MNPGLNLTKNPMVLISDAITLLAFSSVSNFGFEYPESFDDCIGKWKTFVSDILFNDKLVSKQYYADCSVNTGDNTIREVDDEYVTNFGYDPRHSKVNILELLSQVNKKLVENGKLPLNLSIAKESMVNKPSKVDIDYKEINGQTITIVNKDTCDDIIKEKLNSVTNKSIIDSLPDLKRMLHDELKIQVTQGRPKTVTEKKILAGMCLADDFNAPISMEKRQAMVKSIRGLGLSKPDRTEVIEIFAKYRNK